MPDVEVSLNVQANFQAAMTAVANLAKALDVVQQKAKLLPGGGAAAGGEQRADVDVSAAAANREAVAGLAAALTEAAVAAAQLGLAVKSLGPGLKEMGPDGEQVQQVAALGGHYKELAAAMGLAADAAARYKAADGGMKETDDRILKLLAENEALMDRLTAVQNEYQMMVRSNAEREKERVMREENTKAAQKETQATTDNDYQMKLAAMSKRELVAEIQRLTKARKEAAAAGNEYNYKEYGEQLRIARQELRKMNQEQQVNKIAFLQQAQVAQQMGANLRTLTEGVMSFGESLENGSLNLTGMASAAISLGMAIKAGLGPLGWALAAVEALTLAWNVYAKSEKEAAKQAAEFAKQGKAANDELLKAQGLLTEWRSDVFRAEEAKAYAEAIAAQNTEYEKQLQLIDKALAADIRRAAMAAKGEEREVELEKLDLQRRKITGDIDEYEYSLKMLDLEEKLVRVRAKNATAQASLKADAAGKRVDEAQKEYDKIAAEDSGFSKFIFAPEELKRDIASYNRLMGQWERYSAKFEKRDKLEKDLQGRKELFNNLQAGGVYDAGLAISIGEMEDEISRLDEELREAEGARNVAASIKKRFPEIFKGAETSEELAAALALYTKDYNDAKTRDNQLVTRLNAAEKKLNDLINEKDAADSAERIAAEDEGSAVEHQGRVTRARRATIIAQREAADRKKNEQEIKKAEAEERKAKQKEAREKARWQKLQTEALLEGSTEGMTKGARRLIRGGAVAMLGDNKLSGAELKQLLDELRKEKNMENEAFRSLIEELIRYAFDNKMITETVIKKYKKDVQKAKLNLID